MPYQRDPRFLDLFDVRNLGARLQSGLNFSVQLAFLLLLVLVAVGSWVSLRHTRLLYENQASVAHTQEVISEVRAVLATLLSAETGARGYLITNSEEDLVPYEAAARTIDGHLAQLEHLVSDNPEQRVLLQTLRERVQARREHLGRLVAVAGSTDASRAARASIGEGTGLMNSVREVIADIETKETALLAQRKFDARTSYRAAQALGFAVGGTGAVLVLLAYQLVRRLDRLREQAARDSVDAYERFRVTLGSIGDAVLVTDAQGRLTFCNQAAGPMLAVPSDAIGKPLTELFTFTSEATGEPAASVVARALATRGVSRTLEGTTLRLSDGRALPVSATAATIFDRSGQEQGVVLVVRDVSDRRERERELARSNERFRSLVLAMSQIVWTMDADGFVQEDSPSWRRLTGQTYEQWKGLGWLDVIHPEDREGVLNGWKDAIAGSEQYQVEYRLRRADGSYHWTLVRAVPVLDFDGKVREWVGMNHDIQVQKEAEEAERDASRRKGEFIALLAHELRNPLAPLRNGLEVLKSGAPEDAPRALVMMDRQLRHMMRLIDDLLDVSRISHGRLELRLERFDLRDVLRPAIDAARPSIQAKHQHLFVDLPNGPMWVEGDPVRLAQVFTNLLNNAVKYSGTAASIWITAEREGNSQLVTVRDTGQGIPSDLLPLIWDLFLQGRGRVERVEGGLGIGLTLVKRLVEMHGGSVDAHSDGIGSGSEFGVRLPASSAPRTLPAVVAPPRLTQPKPLRILIIDDNEDSAESLSMLLRIGGHAVHAVFRGEAGVEELRKFHPQLILCDIRMPGMSGFEFARRVRAEEPVHTPVLVALTGFGAAADREASTEAGFDHHLVKPVDPAALTMLLQEAAHRNGSS
jgi:PAS domain S-box-containing protein